VSLNPEEASEQERAVGAGEGRLTKKKAGFTNSGRVGKETKRALSRKDVRAPDLQQLLYPECCTSLRLKRLTRRGHQKLKTGRGPPKKSDCTLPIGERDPKPKNCEINQKEGRKRAELGKSILHRSPSSTIGCARVPTKREPDLHS